MCFGKQVQQITRLFGRCVFHATPQAKNALRAASVIDSYSYPPQPVHAAKTGRGPALLRQGDVMKRYLLGIVGVLALTASGPAGAADMPLKAPPLAAPAFNWARCYVGVHAGWGLG